MKYKNWSFVALLVALWALGLVTSVTFGGYIHLLLIAAVVMGLVLFLQGRSLDSDDKNRSGGEL